MISGTEIDRQATRVEEQLQVFIAKTNEIISALREMSQRINTTDSNLSREIMQYSDTYMNIQNKIKTNFINLANTMHNYAQQSILNEQMLSKNVQTSNAELDSINSLINSTNSTNNVRTSTYSGIVGDISDLPH